MRTLLIIISFLISNSIFCQNRIFVKKKKGYIVFYLKSKNDDSIYDSLYLDIHKRQDVSCIKTDSTLIVGVKSLMASTYPISYKFTKYNIEGKQLVNQKSFAYNKKFCSSGIKDVYFRKDKLVFVLFDIKKNYKIKVPFNFITIDFIECLSHSQECDEL